MQYNFLPTEIMRMYRIWTSILYRCNRKENKQYKNYGGRGISICEEWMDFNQFCYDLYPCPQEGYHLDRTNNDKGYFKENCRWVSAKVNHRNKRNNKYYETHLGKLCQSEWIEMIGFTRRQFTRAVEKYGEDRLIEMFKENILPKKRIHPDLNDIVNKKFGHLTVLQLHEDKSCGTKYYCLCDCGKKTTTSRHKLIYQKTKYCLSCARKGDLNPNRIKSLLKKQASA